ncbi:MAG: hypothetical protein JWO13_154 [Acidobacteriales bacterium]|nr:hypothetical protein [Terriglobales bacterium]
MTTTANVTIARDFPHNYQVEILESTGKFVSIGEPPVRIPDGGEDVEALTLKITPADSAPWVGSFARGFAGDELGSGIYAWPDGESLAVVSAGYGYVLKPANRGKNWVRLQPNPITDTRVFADHKLIVFTDFTHMFAYGAEKALWKSERLSWDGITVTQVATNHIFGMAWDAEQNKEVEFVIDVRTGEHTGGAKPWAKR